METVTHYKETCPLCGDDIEITHRYEDGRDWLGHHYGHSETSVVRHPHKCDNIQFKKMCLNCISYNNKTQTCCNSNAYSVYFGDNNKTNVNFTIKKPKGHCRCWQLSIVYINKLFK